MVQVAAEHAAGDCILEVAIGGGQDPHVDTHGRIGSHAGDLARLQDAEELDLRRHRHVADLVEKQCAPVGIFELADPIVGGVGEGAADVTKKLTLEDVLAERRAVECHERLGLPGAVLVDRLGDEFLAGTGLPLDQHRGIRRRDPLEPLDEPLHLRARSDHAFEAELLVEPPVQFQILAPQPYALRRLLDRGPEVRHVEGLLEVGECPLLHRGDGRRNRAVPRHHDHFGLR